MNRDTDAAVVAWLLALHRGDTEGQRAILSTVIALEFTNTLGLYFLGELTRKGIKPEIFLSNTLQIIAAEDQDDEEAP